MNQTTMLNALIAKRHPKPVCDSCLGDYLALSRQQVSAAAYHLRVRRIIERSVGRCSGCCSRRTVTGLAAPAG